MNKGKTIRETRDFMAGDQPMEQDEPAPAVDEEVRKRVPGGTMELSPTQAKIRLFVRDHIVETGFSPSIPEICAHLGGVSTRTVWLHLEQMERKGWIARNKGTGRARSIRLLKHGDSPEIKVKVSGAKVVLELTPVLVYVMEGPQAGELAAKLAHAAGEVEIRRLTGRGVGHAEPE